MKVAVVAEFYPRAADPVLGVWAHRQAVAARDAGADVRVLVLHRPVPPLAAVRALDIGAARDALRQPRHTALDGIEIEYVPFAAPPRPLSYGTWGAWAAPTLALALRRLRRRFPFDLIHAHYAVPAGDAVRRARIDSPLLVSVHGGDVLYTAPRSAAGRRAVTATFAAARLVLANSRWTEERCRELGARATRVVHLGTDLPDAPAAEPPPNPAIATVAHLVPRKRHKDVVRALALLRDRHPQLRYVVIGDGPERRAIASLAAELGVAERVELRGQLGHAEALHAAREATLLAMPSVDEAFGVAYVEAMAAGVPAIGCRGEGGPEEIAAAGGGIELVPPRDPQALAALIDSLLTDAVRLAALRAEARTTVERTFTWERCGTATVAAYEEALR
jgi:glycosyltransferase involved in cell wall biosynthesis